MSDQSKYIPETRDEYDDLDDEQRALLHDVTRELFAEMVVRIDMPVNASKRLSAMMTQWLCPSTPPSI